MALLAQASVISESPHWPVIVPFLLLLYQSDTPCHKSFNGSLLPLHRLLVIPSQAPPPVLDGAFCGLFSSHCSPLSTVQPHRMTCLSWPAPCPWDFVRSSLTAWDMAWFSLSLGQPTSPFVLIGVFLPQENVPALSAFPVVGIIA